MASAGSSIETTLQIRRTFQAPREKVFRAWTDPDQMKHWFAPTADYETTAEVDLRVGGKYRIQMKHTDGSIHTAVGEYREISEPEKLVYTWSWEDGSTSGSLVTVKFRDLGSATELLLTHERFPTAELRDKHGQGWNGCLVRLEEHLAE